MKRSILTGLCLCASAFALDNSVKITNNFTGVLTSIPIVFGRWIKQGEIANYPRPFATPSDTGTRAAITTWQADVKNRWRDATSARTITGARFGSPTWSSGGAGITSVSLTSGIGTITFSVSHGLSVGDRLVTVGTPAATSSPSIPDNVMVVAVDSSTVVRYISRANVTGTFITGPVTYPAGGNVVTITQKIDPMEPVNVCRYFSAGHDLQKGETITVASVGGITASSAIQVVTGVTRDEFVTNATCSGTYTSGGTATGPAQGSVKFAIVSMITTVPSGGSTRIDWINSTNPSSAGNAAATSAAGFDQTAMLAATWNGDLVATADVKSGATGPITTSPRTMLTAWSGTESECGPRYWARGPVVTWFILDYSCPGTNVYDFGWKIRPGTTTSQAITTTGQTQFTVAAGTNIDVGTVLFFYKTQSVVERMTVTGKSVVTTTCNGATISAGVPCLTVTRATAGTAQTFPTSQSVGIYQWDDAGAEHKSLHPSFHLKFMGGSWAGVGVTVDVKNSSMTKQQNLYYSIDFKTGGTPASRIAKSTFKHTSFERWKLSTWDGTDPEFYCSTGGDPEACGATRKRKYLIDHNTPYLSYAGLIPEQHALPTANMNTLDDRFRFSGKGCIIGGGNLDAGTWGQDPSTAASVPNYDFSTTQEGYLFPAWIALGLQTYSETFYEEMFGDSAPGGCGNIEGQDHIPIHWIWDDATYDRKVLPGHSGANDTCVGKPPTLYCAPTWVSRAASAIPNVGSTVSTFDRFTTACSAAAPQAPPVSLNLTDSTGTRGWPCFYYNSTGLDGWSIDNTHINDWTEHGYWMTGDYRYLESLWSMSSYLHAYNTVSRKIGRSWAQPEVSDVEDRSQGNLVRAILNAAIYTPNVPQFGATSPMAIGDYWTEQAWNAGLSKEGFYGITDGWMAQLYPNTFSSTCPSTDANTTASIWSHTRCLAALGNNMPNPLAMPLFIEVTCTTDLTWMNCPTYYTHGMWYQHHQSQQWARASRLGMPMFDYGRREWANTAFGFYGSANWNPFMNDLYQSPTRGPNGSPHPFILTFSDMFTGGLKTTWSPTGPNGNYSRTDQTWFHDCGGIGRCGGALVAIGYMPQWRADLASMKGLGVGTRDGCAVGVRTPRGCTWEHSWSWINQNLPLANQWTAINKYYIEPTATIDDLACTPGGTSTICTYTAPTPDACTYLLGTSAPTTTLDDTDVSDGGGLVKRRLVIGSLTQSTAYNLRLTCGQRVGTVTGTGRTSTTFTTVATDAATTVALQLGAVAYATTVTVDYGSTTAVTTGTVGPTTCTSGCTISIPGVANSTLYYKVTRKTAGGTIVSPGVVQKVMAL